MKNKKKNKKIHINKIKQIHTVVRVRRKKICMYTYTHTRRGLRSLYTRYHPSPHTHTHTHIRGKYSRGPLYCNNHVAFLAFYTSAVFSRAVFLIFCPFFFFFISPHSYFSRTQRFNIGDSRDRKTSLELRYIISAAIAHISSSRVIQLSQLCLSLSRIARHARRF